ncbi:ABC transporter G family member 50-like [Asparagus officinalis]|uniref:ABC transporter G family member 50-like n=1 Tax=Asparagus officinalis TaxID=4686 RepID=UPI00098E476B|nr:ABC transporter G family member 50-like [Asparagus officinalis]
MIFIFITSVVFSALFWKHGKTINNQQEMFNILGSIYIAANFMGTTNCSSILPIILTERTVLYREKFAGMYSSWAYSFAQMVIEIPYVFLQAALFAAITYPAIGYYSSASKFLWFFYTMFCTLLCFVYLGMLLVSLTPNLQVASILSSPCYAIINLFSGFMIPGPKIPKWWIWLYYVSPLSWTLNGLAENTKVVDLALLCKPIVLDFEWPIYFTVWGYSQGNRGVWRNKISGQFPEGLFWVPT